MIVSIYLSAQALAFGISFIIQRRIEIKKDRTELKYLEDPKPFTNTKRMITTTNMRYDLQQNAQARKQAIVGLAFMMFLHFKFGVIRPLVIQSILPIKNALQSKWAQVHLFGKPAEGVLRRPWKADSPFAALTGAARKPRSEAAEKTTIKRAKRAEDEATKSESWKDS